MNVDSQILREQSEIFPGVSSSQASMTVLYTNALTCPQPLPEKSGPHPPSHLKQGHSRSLSDGAMSLNVNRCAVVLDVREQWEWDQGHVSCATRLQVQKRLERMKLNLEVVQLVH